MGATNDIGAVKAITDALSRTRAARGARITVFRGARDVSLSPKPPSLRSTGLLFPLVGLARWLVRNEAAAVEADGVIDFTGRCYMIDFGAYAVLHADGRQWGGASGRALVKLPAQKPSAMVPLWLPDLLDGVRSATEVGTDTVRGASCRHFETDVDLAHASSVLSGDWPTDLGERGVDVWIDDTHVRRIRAWVQSARRRLSSGISGSRSTIWTGLALPAFRTET